MLIFASDHTLYSASLNNNTMSGELKGALVDAMVFAQGKATFTVGSRRSCKINTCTHFTFKSDVATIVLVL